MNWISIHALLAESDSYQPGGNSILHISIHALLAESDISPPFRWLSRCISIHALLAESDGNGQEMAAQCVEFLSTLSLRRATTGHGSQGGAGHRFLSTLSLRRATMPASWIFATPTNFYPRSPCGERPLEIITFRYYHNFYPRSPCGERLCDVLFGYV